MSLVEPFNFTKFWAAYKRPLMIVGLGILLLLVALFLYDCGGDYLFKSKLQKQKDEIITDTKEIVNISNQIHELEKAKEAKKVEVNAATEQLNKDLSGHQEAKTEANQALANFQKAVNSNTNVDRTLEDLERVLEKLKE